MSEKKCKKIYRINARVDEELYRELTEKAKIYQCSMSDIIVSRLKKLPTDVLRRLYQVSLDKAKNDAEWLFFLKEEFGYLDV